MDERITAAEIDALRRIKAEKTTEEIAREIGVSWHSVYHWIRGERTPGRMASSRIRDYLRKHGSIGPTIG